MVNKICTYLISLLHANNQVTELQEGLSPRLRESEGDYAMVLRCEARNFQKLRLKVKYLCKLQDVGFDVGGRKRGDSPVNDLKVCVNVTDNCLRDKEMGDFSAPVDIPGSM